MVLGLEVLVEHFAVVGVGPLGPSLLRNRLAAAGVWVGDAKIGAIGVKISRGVAYHGFSLNVNTDLSYYDYIIPCGIEDKSVTSMAKILGSPVDMEEVRYSVVYHFGRCMGFKMAEVDPAAWDPIPLAAQR